MTARHWLQFVDVVCLRSLSDMRCELSTLFSEQPEKEMATSEKSTPKHTYYRMHCGSRLKIVCSQNSTILHSVSGTRAEGMCLITGHWLQLVDIVRLKPPSGMHV